jgi:tetratricopeptide (TPR) repeat protein
MDVGKYFVPIGMQMASALFDEAMEVSSLPPYMGAYKPDVEAVIEPEILYAYGDAIGTLAGHVEAKVRVRVKGYDLSGKVVWEGEALGESRSDRMDFVSTFLVGMDKPGQVGYQAGLAAAQKIVNDFNVSKPAALYALLEMKEVSKSKTGKSQPSSQLFDKYYQKGMYQFEKKNFQQALYGFQQAEKVNNADLLTPFYVGLCCMYTGQKAQAVGNLNQVLSRNPRDQKLNADCKKWLQRLNDPLKIGLVLMRGSKNSFSTDENRAVIQALTDSRMYEIVEVKNSDSTDVLTDPTKLNPYLDACARRGIKIVLFVQTEKDSRHLTAVSLPEGDTATEVTVTTKVEAYGTGKRKAIAEFTLTETAARMQPMTNTEMISSALLKRSSDRMVLSLLENDLF